MDEHTPDFCMMPQVGSLPVYQPGRPVEEVASVYGHDPTAISKLASNENPLGPSPEAVEYAREALAKAHWYPDGGCLSLERKLRQTHELGDLGVVFGNGSNELLELVAHLFLGPGRRAVMGEVAFPVYEIVTRLVGAEPVKVKMPNYQHDLEAMLKEVDRDTSVVFLPVVDNPTGSFVTEQKLLDFARAIPRGVLLVVDEAYSEFLEFPPDLKPLMREKRNVVCTRTFSKVYGLAGMRIGYAYGVKEVMEGFHRVREPFNVNRVAQAAAEASLSDTAHIRKTIENNATGLERLASWFEERGLPYHPSWGNFVLFELKDAFDAFEFFQSNGVIVRPIPSIPDHIRVSVGTPDQLDHFKRVLDEWLTTHCVGIDN